MTMAGNGERQLIMWNLLTLDGFFEGAKKWDLGFHDYVWRTSSTS
jgi:hypothetical protein